MATAPKRRKLEKSDKLTKALSNTDTKQIQPVLQELRKIMKKDALEKKLEENRHLGDVLMNFLWNCSMHNFDPTLRHQILDVLVVLANFCYLSSELRERMADPIKNLPLIGVRVLESGGKTSSDIKRAMLRLLCNISLCQRGAQVIASNAQLVDRIAMAIGHDEDEIVKVALRAANLLLSSRHGIRPLLLSNVGYYLGTLLARTKEKEANLASEIQNAVFHLVCRFVKYKGAKAIGRQLAGSDGVEILVARFLAGDYEEAMVEMCNASFELREQFETPGCIQKIVQASQPCSEYMLKMLLCFAQDAWGRAALRVQGALDVLINRLASGTVQEQEWIINALRYFVHDACGMNYITFSTKFLETVTDHIAEFLNRNRRRCKLVAADGQAEVGECSDHSRMPSRRASCLCCAMKGQTHDNNKFLTPVSFERFMSNMGIELSSSSTSSHRSWSPSQSPPPGASSPPRALNPSSPTSSWLMDIYVETMEHPLPLDDTHGEIRDVSPLENIQTLVVVGELFLVSWLSHMESNMKRLTTSKIVDTLLHYIAEAPSMVSKAPRAIRRIFRHRLAVENLAHLELHTRVIHTLMIRECSAGRKLMKCGECLIRSDFGDVLLDEFASHIDAPFGLEVLKNLYKSTDEMDVMKACVATLHLVRKEENWRRMQIDHQPVKRLLAKVREILEDSNYQRKWRTATYENGPTLLRQILVALSYLVPFDILSSSLRPSPNIFTEDVPPGDCVVQFANLVSREEAVSTTSDSPDFITFKCGNMKEVIPKKQLCEGSEYFRGMFMNAFSEQFQETFEFSEEKEQCNFSVFCWFLHFACGCGKKCLQLRGSDTPTLLKLSDRYLCHPLSNMLVGATGPLKKLINGHTLPRYLEVMLTTGFDSRKVLRDACISCLMRYCTEDEMFDAMKVVAGNKVATDSLLERLEAFLFDYSRPRKIKL